MAKKKKKDRWTKLAEAAEELNKVLGLEPAIETDNVTEADLEHKLEEASRLITPEDDFSEQTETVLAQFFEEPEEAEAEHEEETEVEEEEVEYTIEEIREYVETTKKRKDLRVFAQEFPDTFVGVIEKMNDGDLKSGKALKGAMLKELDELEEEYEEFEEEAEETAETEEAPEAKKKPKKKPKKKSGKKKKMGVIATIASSIEESGKEGITKEEILDILDEEFPNRDRSSMKNTIGVQVPTRISKERFEIEKTEDGKYRKA